MLDLKVKGLDELKRFFDDAPRRNASAAAEGLGRAGPRIETEVKKDIPTLTGRAKRGVKVSPVRQREGEAEISVTSTGTPSAFFVASEMEILASDAGEIAAEEVQAALMRAWSK